MAFTLIELLAVMGILILVAAIVLPAAMRARKFADRSRTAIDLQAIATALHQYKDAMGDYPRPTEADRGAWLLMRALIAPGDAVATAGAPVGSLQSPPMTDGLNGAGFRLRDGGPTYGPYLAMNKFVLDDDDNRGNTVANWLNVTIRDRGDAPILYFPAARSMPRIDLANGYIGNDINAYGGAQTMLFNFADNAFAFPDRPSEPTGVSKFRAMLGDRDNNGAITGGETPASTGPFVLWAAGPDGVFGPRGTSQTDIERCDDVINLGQR